MNIIITLYLFVVGAALGSFSLVLAWRMHDKKDWVRGRSKCDACHHVLAVKDLIPIYSWLSLSGKCRYCKKSVSSQVFFAELGLGMILALSWYSWPYVNSTGFGYLFFTTWIVCLTIMSALFWYDLRWFTLPSKLIYNLLGFALLFSVFRLLVVEGTFTDLIVYPVLSSILLSGFFAGLYFISSGKWIGFGDVRIAVPLGLLVGSPVNTWLMLFIASTTGVIIALPALITKSKKLTSKIPFGPLLIWATIITVLFGSNIISWYGAFAGF